MTIVEALLWLVQVSRSIYRPIDQEVVKYREDESSFYAGRCFEIDSCTSHAEPSGNQSSRMSVVKNDATAAATSRRCAMETQDGSPLP